MNLTQIRKLKDGDEVEFISPFPAFTVGKKYKIWQTDIGTHIKDDKGLGRQIGGLIYCELHFKPTD